MKAAKAALEAIPPRPSLRSARPCPECALRLSNNQRRSISSTVPRKVAMGQLKMPGNIKSQVPKDALRSQKSMMQDMGKGQIPTDIGLLPLTLISPSAKELYRMFKSDKKKMLSAFFLRMKRSFSGLFALIYMLKWTKRKNRLTGKAEKNPPLELTNRLEVARRLHRKLNQAIVEQDQGTIKEIACAGLSAKVRSRLDSRKLQKLPRESWHIIKYNGILLPKWVVWPFSSLFPNRALKVVSEQVLPFPVGGKDATIRQTVVRIKSRQRYNGGVGQQSKTVDLIEYVVIQKMFGEGMDRGWMIWGTIQPSTRGDIEDIVEANKLQSGDGLLDKVKNMMPMGGGMGGA